jgi:hypothetical protein
MRNHIERPQTTTDDAALRNYIEITFKEDDFGSLQRKAGRSRGGPPVSNTMTAAEKGLYKTL